MSAKPPPPRVAVWIGGDDPLKVGDYDSKPITLLTAVKKKQLLHEGCYIVHLPTNIGLEPARDIFHWVDNSLPDTANEWTTPVMPSHFFKENVPYRSSRIIDFYFSLQYIGTRTDVQLDVALTFFEVFKKELHTMDQDMIEHLCDSIQLACRMFNDSERDLFTDPVISLVALTFANGIHNNLFHDMQAVERALNRRGEPRGLNDFIRRVGFSQQPIRGLLPTEPVFPLLTRLRIMGAPMRQLYSTVPGLGEVPLVSSNVFSGEGTEPTGRELDLWSRISVKNSIESDGWILILGVDSGSNERDENIGDDKGVSEGVTDAGIKLTGLNIEDVAPGVYRIIRTLLDK